MIRGLYIGKHPLTQGDHQPMYLGEKCEKGKGKGGKCKRKRMKGERKRKKEERKRQKMEVKG
jgi:hypothetical protein